MVSVLYKLPDLLIVYIGKNKELNSWSFHDVKSPQLTELHMFHKCLFALSAWWLFIVTAAAKCSAHFILTSALRFPFIKQFPLSFFSPLVSKLVEK